MQKTGIIPSRWASTRFPGKPLHKICGKPMIQWVVEAANKARLLDRVIVATDDIRIAETVRSFGGIAKMTPAELPSGTDRIASAAQPIMDDEIIINIQGDEPLISPALIDTLAEEMEANSTWQMATAACTIDSLEDLNSPNVVKVIRNRENAAIYFSRLPIPFRRDGAPDITSGLYLRHLGIYAYRGAFLKKFVSTPPCQLEKTESLEQLRALDLGAKILVVQTEKAGIGVDTPQDAERLERILGG